jgi:cell division protein FtsW (lipid II flippase)
MKNRASSHLVALLLIFGFQIAGYYAVFRAALLRGFEPTMVGAVRDLLLYVPVFLLVFWLSRRMKFQGNWVLYTTAVLLFSLGALVQYRLYSDPEYTSRNKAEARAEKTQVQRMRFINQFYGPDKKQFMGFPADAAQSQAQLTPETARQSNITATSALTSLYTWIPILALFALAFSYWICTQSKLLDRMQRHSFVIVIITVGFLGVLVFLSSAGKVLGNMTPWELTKIPFLIGFAGVLTAYYRELAKTHWGVPSAQAILPLLVMVLLTFFLFIVLQDFGQILVFIAAYATLYLVAVRRWPQLVGFVAPVLLLLGTLVVGALPPDVQDRVPLLPALSRPVQYVLPPRIKQRFHLWLDGFDPPSPETVWWKKDYDDALARDARMKELAEQSPAMQKTVNVDVWFDRIAFQPSQATFGIASGGTTGRGLGLGFAEVIPVADSDYIYAAIGEELGLVGGAVVILALIVFVAAGVRTAIDARDMFTKLCSAGLTAFIGFQALVNIGGITRALPMTGITLPFVSHGGFSLITSFAMLGMLLAFSHRNARDAQAAVPPERYRSVVATAGDSIKIPEAVE